MPFRATSLRNLSGHELEALLKRLIEAERVACGLEPSDLKALSAANRGDGGIDCLLTQTPPRPTDFLRRGPVVFQFKRSYASFRPAKDLAGEARSWLRRGAGYRLVVTDDLKPDQQAAYEQSVRRRVAKQVGRAVKDVALLSASHLSTWLSEHPSLWPAVPGASPLSGQLRSWEQWEREDLRPAGPSPWVPDAPREEHSRRLLLGLERGEAWRVTGAPGVGKTRFALESLRAMAPAVSYLPRYGDAALDLVASSSPLFGILVVDRCTGEQDRALRRLRRAEGLAVVTIGLEEDGTVEPGETTVRLEPLEHEALEVLARTAAPHLPLDLRLEVARHSGGNPQLFRLLVDAVAATPEPPWSGVGLERESLVDLLSRFLSEGDDDRALSAISLPSIVSFDRDSDDVEVLARTFGVHEADLEVIRKRLEQRGALSTVGRSVYVSPRILGDWLALRAWRATQPGRLLERLKKNGAGQELIERCLRRMDLATKETEEVMLDLASEPRALVDAAGAERVDQLLGRLAVGRPVEVVGVCERLLVAPGSSFTASALAQAAWFEEAFKPAADLLARATVEMPGQVDSRLLTSMFAARYGQTRAHWERRLEVLRALAGNPRPEYRRLAAACATAACRKEPAFAVHVHHRGTSWRIPTTEEDRHYRAGAAAVLGDLMIDPDEETRTRSRASVVTVLRELVRDHLSAVAVVLVRGLVRAHPHLAELQGVREELHVVGEFDLPKLPPEERASVGEIQELLRPAGVADRISWVLARRGATGFEDAGPEVDEAARALVATADPGALDHLFQAGPGERFELGRRSGMLDHERRLLEPIRDRAVKRAAALGFAAGYFHGLEGDPTPDDLLDSWSQDATLARLVLESTRRREPSVRAAARLHGMVVRRLLPASSLELLEAGAWLSKVPRESARSLLRAAMAEPRVAFTLVFQLVRLPDGLWVVPELKEAWIAAGAHIPDRDNLAWRWCEAARLIAREDPGFVAEECLRLLRAGETRDRSHVAEVLGGLLRKHPESLWAGFGELMEHLESDQWLALSIRRHLGDVPALTRQIVRWAREGGAVRRERAADLVAGVSAREGNLGAALLDAFPGDRTVAQRVAGAFQSGHWAGNESDWRSGRLVELGKLADSGRPGLSSWAGERLPELRAEHERARQVDDAWRAGALDVPFHSDRPVMDRLYELAAVQEGFFTTSQARRSGCSPQLLHKYVRSGKVVQAMRGVYRLVQFPRGENEDLVALWLHFDGEAVFSHTTALALYGLSTALPQKAHLTLPSRWARRRLKLPEGVLVHHADLREAEWTQIGTLRVTTIERTLADCEAGHVPAEFIDDARREAIERGLIPGTMSPAGTEEPG